MTSSFSDPRSTRQIVQAAVCSAATAWSFYLMAKFVNHRWHVLRIEKDLAKLQQLLEHERLERRAERQGRIRAEQQLRKHQLTAAAAGAAAAGPAGAGAAAAGPAAAGTAAAGATAGGPAAAGTAAAGAAAAGAAAAGTEAAGAAAAGAAAAGGSTCDVSACACQAHAPVASPAACLADAPCGSSTPASDLQGNGQAATDTDTDRERLASGSHASSTTPGLSAAGMVFPARPIGVVQSCFSQRNGTPRQPLLVPVARCRVQLAPDIPAAVLSGLDQYSHVWVIYVFHENTNLVKLWQGDRSGIKAKIHVPRLNGDKMGVLATRSPHRPVPIGLSVAQVISIKGSSILLGGADIVDGSPVLDIKPYIPFCDCVELASAPAWVKVEAEEEPLRVSRVECSAAASALIQQCWAALYPPAAGAQEGGSALYQSSEEFMELVQQVLSRDIRPVHRRIQSPLWADVPPAPPSFYPGTQLQVGAYHVVLEHVDVSYDIGDGGRVVLRGACPNTVQSQQRGLGLLGGADS